MRLGEPLRHEGADNDEGSERKRNEDDLGGEAHGGSLPDLCGENSPCAGPGSHSTRVLRSVQDTPLLRCAQVCHESPRARLLCPTGNPISSPLCNSSASSWPNRGSYFSHSLSQASFSPAPPNDSLVTLRRSPYLRRRAGSSVARAVRYRCRPSVRGRRAHRSTYPRDSDDDGPGVGRAPHPQQRRGALGRVRLRYDPGRAVRHACVLCPTLSQGRGHPTPVVALLSRGQVTYLESCRWSGAPPPQPTSGGAP